jgi:hypothetical protein
MAEETRRMEQRTSNYGWWQRGDNNAGNNDKKQQSTNVQGRGGVRVRRQRWRTTTAGKRRGTVVEVDEQLLCGGRGETALR